MSDQSPAISLRFDSAVYRLVAVKKAAYKFGDRCSTEITVADRETTVLLKPKTSSSDNDALMHEFRNEVLDQELREVIREETTAVRNLLLAQAFSATSLADEGADAMDYEADPLGIGAKQA